ncbi:MAG TPA: S8 family serine peptidase [Candidatus Kapabacteria bacterium]|nr:S8 family serine peptidase [Candidatus Kapabacteria bacterium]
MKRIIIYLVAFALTATTLYAQNYINNRVIIKLKDSKQMADFQGELKSFISNYNIRTFLSSNSINALHKKLKLKETLLSNNYLKNYHLEKIYIIEYKDKIDPTLLSTKLSSNKYLSYAEPQYLRQLFSNLPNDSLLASQYALFNCEVLAALDLLKDVQDSVTIGVVDTGLDYKHEDLQNIMWINSGEDGQDENGNDKRTNGIDDDANGYIDDWHGWDFGSSDSTGQDNDPYLGGSHGTHVAGIIAANTNNKIGVAGINPFAKILAVKIGFDNPWVRSLVNSYEGLLYAAMMGADIINCSWGGGGYSQAEDEIVQQAVAFGTLIVAAAGNNNENTTFYPSSYKNVISVASTDENDIRSSFSNYHYSVDVAAPGTAVMSTIPDNAYQTMSGTSMASPVAAAIAGLIKIKYPHFSNLMIGEHLKASANNIDTLNTDYIGLIGRGRVNAYKAITDTNLYSLNISKIDIIKVSKNNILLAGDTVRIKFSLLNALKPLTNVNLKAHSKVISEEDIIIKDMNLGNFATMESKSPEEFIEIIVPEVVGLDISVPIIFEISSNEGYKIQTSASILVNPSYRTIDKNNISLTVGSIGNISYNDYPINSKGDGFTWKGSSNCLFEGSLMVAVDTFRISDVARGANPSKRNNDLQISLPIKEYFPGRKAAIDTYAEYEDIGDSLSAGVKVNNYFYEYTQEDMEDCVVAVYDIINKTTEKFDSLFVGNYYDWDIGVSGANNFAYWDYDNNIGISYNAKEDSLPYIGMMLISKQKVNYFAIDNDGTSDDNPGVYDNFSDEKKWKMLTNGIGRDSTGIKDISAVISAGPIQLESKDTTRVIFVLFVANSVDNLIAKSKNIRLFMDLPSNLNDNVNPFQYNKLIKKVYPNPVNSDNINIELFDKNTSNINIKLYDMKGNIIINDDNNAKLKINVANLVSGSYLLEVQVGQEKEIKKVIINR